MNEGFQKLFWGCFFIFFEIHIFIDLLLDPVGYMLIFSGLRLISHEYPLITEIDKAKRFAMLLTFLSIPTVFISNVGNEIQRITLWDAYLFSIGIIQFILIYFIFIIMLEFAKTSEAESLYTRTSKLFNVYTTVFITITILQTFSINFTNNLYFSLLVILNIVMLILTIVFLVHLHRYKKWQTV
ncbi:hypothetical protein ACWE42_23280 [Sutcliffiella cohnii]